MLSETIFFIIGVLIGGTAMWFSKEGILRAYNIILGKEDTRSCCK